MDEYIFVEAKEGIFNDTGALCHKCACCGSILECGEHPCLPFERKDGKLGYWVAKESEAVK